MGRLFGTDGVRGLANSELTGKLALNWARPVHMCLPWQSTSPEF